MSAVEVTTRYVTRVDTLRDAWAFVMTYVDRVGPDPRIEIKPYWTITPDLGDDDPAPRSFEVIVDGMVPEPSEVAV